MSTYRERETLETQLLNFFDKNRDEFLYIEDIQAKFDAKQKHAQVVASGLVQRGLLTRRQVPSDKGGKKFCYGSVQA